MEASSIDLEAVYGAKNERTPGKGFSPRQWEGWENEFAICGPVDARGMEWGKRGPGGGGGAQRARRRTPEAGAEISERPGRAPGRGAGASNRRGIAQSPRGCGPFVWVSRDPVVALEKTCPPRITSPRHAVPGGRIEEAIAA